MSDKKQKTENQKEREENLAQEETVHTPESGQEQEEKAEENGNASAEEAEKTEEKSEKTLSPEEKLVETEKKLAEFQDKYMRLTAEFDNFRKRTLKEKMDLQISANEHILTHLLGVKDDFERAMESVKTAKDVEAVKSGLDLIYNKFSSFFTQQGVKEIDAMGEEFNTDVHEAVTKMKVDNKKQKGKIVDVIEKGYLLKDKVIRYAKVVIGE